MSRLARVPTAVILFAVLAVAAAAQNVPTIPGDGNADWSVDDADFALLTACLTGPGAGLLDDCAAADLNADGEVSLFDVAGLQVLCTGTQVLAIDVPSDADDGTEIRRHSWLPQGYWYSGRNRLGAAWGEVYDLGLRFSLPQVNQGEQFVYARVVLPGTGDGYVGSGVQLRVVGVNEDSPAPFDVRWPSELPKTTAETKWNVASNWPEPYTEFTGLPLRRCTPDIAPLVNEVLSRPNWGHGAYGKMLALVIEDSGSANTNFVTCNDYRVLAPWDSDTIARPTLELFRTVRSTFVGKELLGCPTARSVVLSAMSLLTLEANVEWGTTPGVYSGWTAPVTFAGGTPIEVLLDGLKPDTRYFYRLCYRPSGARAFEAGPERTFHTARPPGSTFAFTVQADSHAVYPLTRLLYARTLQNVLADGPDFHIDLGDTFHCERYNVRDVLDLAEAVQWHLDQRRFFDLVCHSAPFFMALGNHEGEQGWRLDGTPDNVAVWATLARKLLYPLPSPDVFYGGNGQWAEFVGLREDYYAWQWGDALFVVLDPFWYTVTKPHWYDLTPGSGDNWDWTLGREQYDWLGETLARSQATFKFVFSHHMTGGVNTYGRGGVEAARHELGGRGSFEWGGEDREGHYVFDERRPGWGVPVHQLLADNQVTIFFHGHDHLFVKQMLDGVVYQECPQPGDAHYGWGFYYEGRYLSGDRLRNSGHLRVTVSPEEVQVQHVRAYLPGDGPNGEVAYAYTVRPAAR